MSDDLREAHFTRSRCLGGALCVAGCTVHKKVRKRLSKQVSSVVIPHSGYGLEPEIVESSEDDDKLNSHLSQYIGNQNGFNSYYDKSELMSEDESNYDEITIVRRVTNIFRITITNTSNLIDYVTPTPVKRMTKRVPFLWPLFLLTALLGSSAYLYSHYNSSPLKNNIILPITTSDVLSSNYALTQITDELKSIRCELENLKKTNVEMNSKVNNDNIERDNRFVHLNDKVDNLEDYIMNMLKNCCRNNSEAISSLIDARLASFITTMFENNDRGMHLKPEEAADQLKLIINNEIERSNKVIKDTIERKLISTMETIEKQFGQSSNAMSSNISIDEIKLLIQNALAIYDADKTGQPDFALEPAGGTVINTRCSETFDPYGIQYRIFGMPVWSSSVSPRAVIQPTISPGECWAFRGSQGYLVIKLSQLIVPTAFSYEHIPKQISRDGNINSAPKEFQVRGLADETDTKGHLLGNYVYEDNDRPMQHFLVQDPNPTPFQIIELIILSNHGHDEYTCLYRFRVHGKRVNY